MSVRVLKLQIKKNAGFRPTTFIISRCHRIDRLLKMCLNMIQII